MVSIKEVKKELMKRGISFNENEFSKNGATKVGLSVGDGEIKPVIYEDDLGKYKNVEEVMVALQKAIEDAPKAPGGFWENCKDYDKVKDKVRKVVLNMKNSDKLVMHPICGDIGYAFVLDLGEDGYYARITKDIANVWNVTVDQLMEDAIVEETLCKDLNVVLVEMMGLDASAIPAEAFGEPKMYMVSNEKKTYGAANIFCDKDLHKELEEIFGNKFYVIPSSIHEVLCTECEEEDKSSELKDIIKTVNETEVDEKDFLSDSLYLYDNGEFSEITNS